MISSCQFYSSNFCQTGMDSSGFEELLPANRSRTKCIRAQQWSAAANKIKHNFPVDKERWKSCYGGENNQFVKLTNHGEKKTKHEKKEMLGKQLRQQFKQTNASAVKKLFKPKTKASELSTYKLKYQNKNIEEMQKRFEMLQLEDVKKFLAGIITGPAKRKAQDNNSSSESEGPAKIPRLSKSKIPKLPFISFKPTWMERKSKVKNCAAVNERRRRIVSDSSSESNESSSYGDKMQPAGMRMRLRGLKIEENEFVPELISCEAPVILDQTALNSSYVNQGSFEESTNFVSEMLPFLENQELDELELTIFDDFISSIPLLNLDDVRQAIESDHRICSFAWHPNSSNKPILAVGNSKGTISLWDVNNQDSDFAVRQYDIHESAVTGLSFDRFNPLRLFTFSRDGSVFWLDFCSGIFDEVYSVSMNSVTHLVQKDATTLILSLASGEVLMIDLQAANPANRVLKRIKCFDGSIASLSLHPLENNLLLASSNFGEVAVFYLSPWDISLEAARPVITFPQSSTGLHSAHFSPLTGKYVSTLSGEMLSIFDIEECISHGGGEAKLLHRCKNLEFCSCAKIASNVWHPQREDFIFASGFDDPERVDMLSLADGQIVHSFQDVVSLELFNLNAFHSSMPILTEATRANSVYCPSAL